MKILSSKPFRSIKTKLIIALVLSSLFLTSLVVFLNFYTEYNKDLAFLDQKIQQINESSIPSIVNVVWNLDIPYLTVQAESIVRIKDIVKVKIIDTRNQVMVEKFHNNNPYLDDPDNLRIYKSPLYHLNKRFNTQEYLGTVEITATTNNIKADIYNRVKLILVAEMIKTFLLSYLILMIIHHYINKNIEKIIRFTKEFNPVSTETNFLVLDRKDKKSDEFDILKDAINRMIDQLNYLNKEKEKKISEQEKKIEIQQAAAITSSKLAALGEMAGGIAHEINNPLSIIHTNTKIMERMIEKGIPDQALFLKSTKNILKTIDRIGNIIKGLKNVSRNVSNEKKDSVTFRTILIDVISLCEERFKHHDIKILCNLDDPIFDTIINCYQVQLSQVFLNLFNNSFDAVDPLDEKWIRIEASKEVSKNEHWFVIRFTDSGKGIPVIIRDNIFQPFYTTKDIGKGTGLGLSLIYGIIKSHNGEIYYDDHYKNTCFTIKLPL